MSRFFKPTVKSVGLKGRVRMKGATARNDYIKDVLRQDLKHEYHGVLSYRNVRQAKYNRQIALGEHKMGVDALLNLHLLNTHVRGFIIQLDTLNDFICIVGMKFMFEMVDKILQKNPRECVFGYDTTYELGDYYCSVLVFRHPYLSGNPGFPIAFMLHDKRLQKVHNSFMEKMCTVMPTFRTAPFIMIMDREKALKNAVRKSCSKVHVVFCWNHLLKDVELWVRRNKSGISGKQDEYYYRREVKKLLHCNTRENYLHCVDNSVNSWSLTFTQYFARYIDKDIQQNCGRFVLEPLGIYSAESGITNNICESYNHLIKAFLEHREASPDVMVLKAYALQSCCIMELKRWRSDCGEFMAVPGTEGELRSFADSDITLVDTQEVMQAVRSDLDALSQSIKDSGEADTDDVLTQCQSQSHVMDHSYIATGAHANLPEPSMEHSLAVHAYENNRVEHIARMKVFVVQDENGDCHCVRLAPTAMCKCPAPKNCWHILAAKMKAHIYQQVVEPKPKINLTKLSRSGRVQLKKRSGRKEPRPGDIDDTPAVFSQSMNTPTESDPERCKKRNLLTLGRNDKRGVRNSKTGLSVSRAIMVEEGQKQSGTEVTTVMETVATENQGKSNEQWLPNLNLKMVDRDVLTDPEEWLTDRTVESSSQVLGRQYDGMVTGLSCPLMVPLLSPDGTCHYGEPYRLQRAPIRGNHVQIHHNNQGHWVCSARTDDGVVYLCDSLSESNHGQISKSLKIQLAHVYGRPDSNLSVIVPRTMQQNNTHDCGVFAIAQATAFCESVSSGDTRGFYMGNFIRETMREQLLHNLENDHFDGFNTITGAADHGIVKVITIKIECTICSLPPCTGPQGSCDACNKLFHRTCGKRLEMEGLSGMMWLCNTCYSAIEN